MATDELSTRVDCSGEMPPSVSERETLGICATTLSELHRCGNALVSASQSLLDRVCCDDASPYAAPVSRIHHLATTLCNQLIEIAPDTSHTSTFSAELIKKPTWGEGDRCVMGNETINNASRVEIPLPIVMADIDDIEASQTHRPARVLVIDESPFIRMLLNSAIESAGYPTLTIAGLDDAGDQLNDSQASDIVIWGGVASAAQTDCLTEWMLRREDSKRPMLIGLVDGTQKQRDMSAEFDHIICRSHLQELMEIIRNRCGHGDGLTKKTA